LTGQGSAIVIGEPTSAEVSATSEGVQSSVLTLFAAS